MCNIEDIMREISRINVPEITKAYEIGNLYLWCDEIRRKLTGLLELDDRGEKE